MAHLTCYVTLAAQGLSGAIRYLRSGTNNCIYADEAIIYIRENREIYKCLNFRTYARSYFITRTTPVGPAMPVTAIAQSA